MFDRFANLGSLRRQHWSCLTMMMMMSRVVRLRLESSSRHRLLMSSSRTCEVLAGRRQLLNEGGDLRSMHRSGPVCHVMQLYWKIKAGQVVQRVVKLELVSEVLLTSIIQPSVYLTSVHPTSRSALTPVAATALVLSKIAS